MNDWLRVDTHVHLHYCYDDGAFLDAAAENICIKGSEDTIRAVLCFTETHGVSRFVEWAKQPMSGRIGQSEWSIAATNEEESLLVTDACGRTMAIIAGRQIECLEGIEVLAIGYVSDLADGQPVADVLSAVAAAGAIPVLPWGFLKWLGRRGKVVDDLLRDAPSNMLFGDNGARLAASPEPRHLAKARQQGIPVLPGTDPFPFAWDIDRVGSFGLQCEGRLSKEAPYADLKDIVLQPGFSAASYGQRLGLLPFIRNQVAIQLRKRLGMFSG